MEHRKASWGPRDKMTACDYHFLFCAQCGKKDAPGCMSDKFALLQAKKVGALTEDKVMLGES